MALHLHRLTTEILLTRIYAPKRVDCCTCTQCSDAAISVINLEHSRAVFIAFEYKLPSMRARQGAGGVRLLLLLY